MNKLGLVTKSGLAAAAMLISLAAIPAQAQGIPGGSYARTCTNIHVQGGQLTADCKRMDGSWDRSSVSLQRCGGGVSNMDGRLTCGGGRNYESRDYSHGNRQRWQDPQQGYGGSSGYQPYGGYNYYGR